LVRFANFEANLRARCTNAGVKGSFGFETTGVFLAGAPATGAVAFIGELKLRVTPSGEGVMSGHVASSEGGTFLTFAEAPVTGSYSVAPDCRGRATITPKGRSEMHFHLVVVYGGMEMLAIETDADTVVSGTLVKKRQQVNGLATPSPPGWVQPRLSRIQLSLSLNCPTYTRTDPESPIFFGIRVMNGIEEPMLHHDFPLCSTMQIMFLTFGNRNRRS
jgi:hypothetical protein